MTNSYDATCENTADKFLLYSFLFEVGYRTRVTLFNLIVFTFKVFVLRVARFLHTAKCCADLLCRL